MNNNSITFDYKTEVLRKSIHLCSLSIPIIYYFISKGLALWVLIPLTIFSITLDLSRYHFNTLGKVFYRFFGFMLREHEKDQKKKNLNGASYVFISATVSVLLFPKIFFLTSFTILIVSDIMAALIGRKFGKHKFLFKSLEGSLAFFVSACLVVLITPKISYLPVEYLIGIISAFVAMIAENVSYGWMDDNFTIPISASLTMWILYILLLPGINVYFLG